MLSDLDRLTELVICALVILTLVSLFAASWYRAEYLATRKKFRAALRDLRRAALR